MVKQILLILPLFFLVVVLSASENRTVNTGNSASSAIRNSNEFNYNKISGNKDIKEEANFSEDFNLPVLRSTWSSKSEESKWSLKERPGYLRLKSQNKTEISNITSGSFSKEIEFNTTCDATCHIDLSNLNEGNETGMYYTNKHINYIEIEISNGIKKLKVSINNKVYEGPNVEVSQITFRTRIESTKGWFEYSVDGSEFIKIGEEFVLNASHNKTDNVGIFCLSQLENEGSSDIDWFYFKQKKSTSVHFAELIKDNM